MGRDPFPSPDGLAILMQTQGTVVEAPRLIVLDRGAAQPLLLEGTTGAYERERTSSPDGRFIAFTSLRDDPLGDIFVADIAGSRLTKLRNLTHSGVFDCTPALIGIVNASSGEPRFLDLPGKAYSPAWSPDGGRIAFASDDGIDIGVQVVSPQGVELAHVARRGNDCAPAWIRRLP